MSDREQRGDRSERSRVGARALATRTPEPHLTWLVRGLTAKDSAVEASPPSTNTPPSSRPLFKVSTGQNHVHTHCRHTNRFPMNFDDEKFGRARMDGNGQTRMRFVRALILSLFSDAVRQEGQVRRVLLAFPGQVPSPARGQDRLLCAQAAGDPGEEQVVR